jgi:hypothetical protein
VPLLSVTGIGGSGKSTVLGSFIRPYLDQMTLGDPDALAVVVIDFDRVLFRPDAKLELSFEVTRQLGYAAPVAAADFSALRYQAQTEQRQSAPSALQSVTRAEKAIREARGFETEAGVLVRMHELQHRPVLLVLDTFEEWQRERSDLIVPGSTQSDPEARVLSWISRIRHEMGLGGLRVIVSGRAELTAADAGRTLHVGDLQAQAARALLRAVGVRPGDTTALAELVGRNPLTLHVAARFYRGLPEAARREFLGPAVDELRPGSRRRCACCRAAIAGTGRACRCPPRSGSSGSPGAGPHCWTTATPRRH